MFLALLIAGAVSDNVDFDPYEMRHYINQHCSSIPKSGIIQLRETGDDVNYDSSEANYYRECIDLKEVTLANGIKTIGDYCFYGSGINKFTISNDLETIGEGAFAFCRNLKSIDFPSDSGIKTISRGAFFYSALGETTKVEIKGKNLVSIEEYAFEGCPLVSSTLTMTAIDGATTPSHSIGNRAFYRTGIVSINLPHLYIIGDETFAGCTQLGTINSNAIYSLTIGDSAFENCNKLPSTISITSTSIGKKAFFNINSAIGGINQVSQNNNLQGIEIGEYAFSYRTISCSLIFKNAITIKKYAFYHCIFNANGGGSIDISNTPASIEAYAFANSSFNTKYNINFHGGQYPQHSFEFTKGSNQILLVTDSNNKGVFNEYAFYGSDVSKNNEVDPLYISSVSERAFQKCPNLRGKLDIDTTVDIGDYAFADCPGISDSIKINFNTHVNIAPSTICKIGKSAFENTGNKITTLKITADHNDDEDYEDIDGNDDTTERVIIEERAFFHSGLECPIVLHSFISDLHEYSFSRCSGLLSKQINIYSRIIHPYAFAECGTFTGDITIFSKSICFHCFDENTLGKVTIVSKETETTIESQAFYGLKFTGPLTIKEGTEISPFAFIFSTFAQNIKIDSSSIESYAFTNCSITSKIVLSIGETEIGPHAFECFGCNHDDGFTLNFHGLTEITGNRIIDECAFNGSAIQGSLTIPDCYNAIGDCAFYNCRKIKSITIDFGQKENDEKAYSIGQSAFEGCSSVTDLFLKSRGALTKIGSRAFICLPIENELILPSHVKEIGSSAFENCTNLPGLKISTDSSMETFGSRSFCNCEKLSGELYIPSKTQIIEVEAFQKCGRLNRLTLNLEGALSEIKKSAFQDCASLTGFLDIPYGVQEIGGYAFAGCNKLGDHLTIRSKIGDDGNQIYCSIGEHAFDGCTGLLRLLQISDDDSYKIKSIGAFAFVGSGIESDIYIPDSLTTIDESAFYGCPIKRLIFGGSSQLETIGPNAFQNSGIYGDLKLPKSLISIGESAFENCKKLGELSFEKQTGNNKYNLYIYKRAFAESSISGKLEIPYGITYIDEECFQNCNQLQEIIFSNKTDGQDPSSLFIYDNAFNGCTFRGNLVFPTHLSHVYDNAFANCQNLNDAVFIFSGTFEKNVFDNCANLKFLFMSGGTLGEHDFSNCNNFNGTIFLKGTVTIGENAFSNWDQTNLTLAIFDSANNHITFNRRSFYNSSLIGPFNFTNPVIKSIGEEAFAECKFISTGLKLQSESVSDDAFANSVFNGSLIINYDEYSSDQDDVANRITYQRIFKGVTGFTDLKIFGKDSSSGGKKTKIPDYAFAGMPFETGLLIIDEQVSTIGKYAFQGCNFYEIYLPGTYKPLLSEGSFSGCAMLNTTVDLSRFRFDKIENSDNIIIPPRLFYGCRNLPSVIFPDSVAKVGNEAFSGCSSLSFNLDFFLGEKLTAIGNSAFSGCSSLRGALEIPTNLKTIGRYAFSDCTGLSDSLTIHVSPTVLNSPNPQAVIKPTFIGPWAFKGCDGFKKGKLFIFIANNEEDIYQTTSINADGTLKPYYRYQYFLTIGNEAFEDTKFKDIYYNGRFQPDCDYDIGFSHTKGIHTSSNYVNKTFCNYPLHSSKLSGGAIAGITIAVIVVVAAIVLLIIFLICRNKKNKDNSEDEVEMNADP